MQDFLRVPRQAFVDSKPRYTGLSTAATPSKATRHGRKREIVWTSWGISINLFDGHLQLFCCTDSLNNLLYKHFACSNTITVTSMFQEGVVRKK